MLAEKIISSIINDGYGLESDDPFTVLPHDDVDAESVSLEEDYDDETGEVDLIRVYSGSDLVREVDFKSDSSPYMSVYNEVCDRLNV